MNRWLNVSMNLMYNSLVSFTSANHFLMSFEWQMVMNSFPRTHKLHNNLMTPSGSCGYFSVFSRSFENIFAFITLSGWMFCVSFFFYVKHHLFWFETQTNVWFFSLFFLVWVSMRCGERYDAQTLIATKMDLIPWKGLNPFHYYHCHQKPNFPKPHSMHTPNTYLLRK